MSMRKLVLARWLSDLERWVVTHPECAWCGHRNLARWPDGSETMLLVMDAAGRWRDRLLGCVFDEVTYMDSPTIEVERFVNLYVRRTEP
jgi:hypothetical protein